MRGATAFKSDRFQPTEDAHKIPDANKLANGVHMIALADFPTVEIGKEGYSVQTE